MPLPTGSLVCVGVGMTLGSHLTPLSRSYIESADVVFAATSDGIVELWLAKMNPDVRSLQPFYREGKSRAETYREMVAAMLAEVRAGKRVCGAFYGHPGVFAGVPHEAIEQARREGYAAHMEPGVSAEDCLYADLGHRSRPLRLPALRSKPADAVPAPHRPVRVPGAVAGRRRRRSLADAIRDRRRIPPGAGRRADARLRARPRGDRLQGRDAPDAAAAHRAHDDRAAAGGRHRHARHGRHSARPRAAARRRGPRATRRTGSSVGTDRVESRRARASGTHHARLLLRSIRESDEELYCELFCDPETMRFIGPPWTRADAARAFRGVLEATRATPPRALFLTMVPKDAQQPIGLCTSAKFRSGRTAGGDGRDARAVTDARTASRSEALIAVIAHAFATLPVDEVWVRIALDHAACERTAVIIGLVRHAQAAPEDLAANLWRWSAYRGSWRPPVAGGGFCALLHCERLSFPRRLGPEYGRAVRRVLTVQGEIE